MLERTRADLNLLGPGHSSGRCIDHENNLPVFDQIHDVGTAFGEFQQRGDGNSGIGQFASGAAAGDDLESEIVEALTEANGGALVDIPDTEKDRARFRQGGLGSIWLLA